MNYTEQSWAPFASARTNAADVLKKADATKAEINTAYVALVNFGKALTWK